VIEGFPPQPPCLKQFSHVNRYWDRMNKTWAAKILPGEYYVTPHPNEVIATTLGSCVSACIRDKVLGIGGMNHFMLPLKSEHSTDDWMGTATRYGSYAMEHLINDILKLGGNRQHLEVKLTGGGQIMANMCDVGAQNIKFVLGYLEMENIDVVIQDLGDIYPRKVVYWPTTGRLRVLRLKSLQNDTLFQREKTYSQELATQPNSGSIELF
jgi:chemotaxis protein CheD